MSSGDEALTDEGKRKKSTGETLDVFTKSRKTNRTPEKSIKTEDKWERMMNMLQNFKKDMMQELRTIREEQRAYTQELKKVKETNEMLTKENIELKNDIKIINNKLENIDRQNRRSNLVIQGLNIANNGEDSIRDEIELFIKTNLDVEVKIQKARKLANGMYWIQMGNTDDKYMVMKNKSKLRGQKIYINEDMSKEQREIQKKIEIHAKEERKDGKKVKIGYKKLIINGEKWNWNPIKNELEKEIRIMNDPKN